jgi:hypothetical protein
LRTGAAMLSPAGVWAWSTVNSVLSQRE